MIRYSVVFAFFIVYMVFFFWAMDSNSLSASDRFVITFDGNSCDHILNIMNPLENTEVVQAKLASPATNSLCIISVKKVE